MNVKYNPYYADSHVAAVKRRTNIDVNDVRGGTPNINVGTTADEIYIARDFKLIMYVVYVILLITRIKYA